MNNKKEENVQNSTASIPKEPYSPPKFWLACPENDFDFDIRKACGPNGENPWIHDGCYESAGIRPGKDITLEQYQKIVYTTETGYKGILETNKNGDPQVTVGLPNGESSSWIDYGYETGEELAKLIEIAEERGTEAWMALNELSFRGIERVMAQKKDQYGRSSGLYSKKEYGNGKGRVGTFENEAGSKNKQKGRIMGG